MASLQLKSDGSNTEESRSEQLIDMWPETDTLHGRWLVFGGPAITNR